MQVVTVGRLPDNTIQIEGDPQVSRHHVQLSNDNGQYYITDLNSTNGTFVNGKSIRGTQRIQPRDVIRLGNTTIPWLMYFDDNYVRHLNGQRRNPQEPIGRPAGPASGGVYVIPGSEGGRMTDDKGTNGMAITGFVLAFLFPVLGIIFSAIGMGTANKNPNLKGNGLAVAGLIISIVGIILYVAIVVS